MTPTLSWWRRVALLLTGATLVLLATMITSAATASAHPLSTSAVLLDLDDHQATATVELPLDQLSIAQNQQLTAADVVSSTTLPGLRSYVQSHLSATDATGQTWTTAVTGGRVEAVDGTDNLVLDATLTPATGTVGDFVLHYDAVMDRLISHRVFVSARHGHTGPYTTVAMLSWQTQAVPVATITPPASQGFAAAVQLGIHHIANGSDHLLFLLTLLLPAPLIVSGRRWTRPTQAGWTTTRRACLRVVHVVTAFAVGHSITLALSALGWIHLPTRVVESGIALSVLVSAVHALRPLVRRGEILIAGSFGLLHGLAFAAILTGLDLTRAGLVSALLGFNLGIELTQLLVVALVMPSLVLLSRTPAYRVARTSLAATAATLAASWLAERTGLIPANPLAPIGNLLVDHPLVLAATLALTSITISCVHSFTRRIQAPIAHPRQEPASPSGPLAASPDNSALARQG